MIILFSFRLIPNQIKFIGTNKSERFENMNNELFKWCLAKTRKNINGHVLMKLLMLVSIYLM